MKEYFSKNISKISYFPVFPTLAKFGVFPRTVITAGNSHHRYFPANLVARIIRIFRILIDSNADISSTDQSNEQIEH